ncbi:hypothetical protein DPQ25_07810 [Hydrogeniiclostridium mannosilyticum]|uniref:Uncharacterized protein n=1 Tax=Hydrogeniiclostridium mannosilyticum TaxID=2764322 RepID=A0A328UCT6_9FIRM|nr:hypothetical protein DPQ25_07810 [Hydrogeniiclostridium mannosilyticum]
MPNGRGELYKFGCDRNEYPGPLCRREGASAESACTPPEERHPRAPALKRGAALIEARPLKKGGTTGNTCPFTEGWVFLYFSARQGHSRAPKHLTALNQLL